MTMLNACTDCALIIANDDDSGMSPATADSCRAGIVEWLEAGLFRLVVTGTEAHFSQSNCEVCSVSIAGDRIEVTAYAA